MKKIIFICIVLVVTATSCFSGGKEHSGSEENPRLVLKNEGVEYAYPRFSKDASEILIQSNESGYWRLSIIKTDGSLVKALTADSVNSYFADWSPDNEYICFVSDRSGNEEIYLMKADGSDQQQLTFNHARNIHPYFSPDGKQLYFSSTLDRRGGLDIYRMNDDGTHLTRITNTPDNETCVRMSPHHKYLVYLKNNNNGLDDLFLFSLSDSTEVNLTNTPTRDGWPTWTPDGKQIISSAIENYSYRLFAYNLEKKTFTRLTNPEWPGNDCRANVSADGKMIVFNRQYDKDFKRTNAVYILQLD